jgi:hypothetical protein
MVRTTHVSDIKYVIFLHAEEIKNFLEQVIYL